ncbi:MAG: hypothetical protein MZV64_43555 [Ignavibacteriales bacterium]|nr:hypothetical protein [Ignavibacteriales bacterium]
MDDRPLEAGTSIGGTFVLSPRQGLALKAGRPPAGTRPSRDRTGGDDVDACAEDVGDEDLAAADRGFRPELRDFGQDGEDHLPGHAGRSAGPRPSSPPCPRTGTEVARFRFGRRTSSTAKGTPLSH